VCCGVATSTGKRREWSFRRACRQYYLSVGFRKSGTTMGTCKLGSRLRTQTDLTNRSVNVTALLGAGSFSISGVGMLIFSYRSVNNTMYMHRHGRGCQWSNWGLIYDWIC